MTLYYTVITGCNLKFFYNWCSYFSLNVSMVWNHVKRYVFWKNWRAITTEAKRLYNSNQFWQCASEFCITDMTWAFFLSTTSKFQQVWRLRYLEGKWRQRVRENPFYSISIALIRYFSTPLSRKIMGHILVVAWCGWGLVTSTCTTTGPKLVTAMLAVSWFCAALTRNQGCYAMPFRFQRRKVDGTTEMWPPFR